jgi:YhcH/YjgK/YiaL family protein
MILDIVDRGHHYADMHPLFGRAFEFLRTTDLKTLAPGRHELEGERLYLSIDDAVGRGRAHARLEHHRRYIDIQLCLSGEEHFGWLPLGCCNTRDGQFDPTLDIGFFEDQPQSWIHLAQGTFVVFFPADAHAPLAGTGPVRKAVMKVGV